MKMNLRRIRYETYKETGKIGFLVFLQAWKLQVMKSLNIIFIV